MTNKDSPDSHGPISPPILLPPPLPPPQPLPHPIPPPPLTRNLALRFLRFYERPSIREKKWHWHWHWYRNSFKQKRTRRIVSEVTVTNLQWNENPTYNLGFTIYNPVGTTFYSYSDKWDIWCLTGTARYRAACGWDDPGHWPLGAYRVEVTIDGALLAKGSFTIK
jgi:hypothetical protein